MLAGKHVLCEKATTSNAPELKDLLKLAKEKNLFFMEAMWTRFQPITQEVKRIAEQGNLGDPVVLHADLSGDFDVDSEQIYDYVEENQDSLETKTFPPRIVSWIPVSVEAPCWTWVLIL